MSLEDARKFHDDFEKFMRQESVPIYLDNEDEMCLRRLTEHDVHEPDDLTADEAKQGVVGVAIQWLMTTFSRLSQTGGTMVLHYSDDTEEQVDWMDMFVKCLESSLKPNTGISLQVAIDIAMVDGLRDIWNQALERPIERMHVIRFAIQWRHYCFRMWARHNKSIMEPNLGIRFGEGENSRFAPMVI